MRGFLLAAAVATVLTLSGPRAAVAAPGDNPPEIGLGAGQLLIGTAIASVALRGARVSRRHAGRAARPGRADRRSGGCRRHGVHARSEQQALWRNLRIRDDRCVSGCDSGPPTGLLAWHADDDDGGTNTRRDPPSRSWLATRWARRSGRPSGGTSARRSAASGRGVSAPPVLSGADDQRWPELRWRPVRGARVAPAVTVPLLVFAF